MRNRQLLQALPVLLITTLGCATRSGAPATCPPSIEQTLSEPRLLREAADAALEDKDQALAYRYLALIETLHPDSAESRELFPAAAKLFKTAYMRSRVSGPNSVWVTSEPVFMFQWLARFFEDEGEFPQQQVDLLFSRMPLTLFDEFKAYGRTRPKLSRWEMQATDDDGRVETITARLVEAPHRPVISGS